MRTTTLSLLSLLSLAGCTSSDDVMGLHPDAGGDATAGDTGVMVLVDGGLLLPDGNVVAADGAITLADGALWLPDGDVVPGDAGVVVLPDGGVLLPDGDVVPGDSGVIVLPDGSVLLPDGAVVPDDAGVVVLPDGGVLLPDGAVVPDDAGVVVLPDGGVLLPDGAVVPDDAGVVVLPDGGVLLPDGAVVAADGGPPDASSGIDAGSCGLDCTSDAACGEAMRCLPGGMCPTGAPTHHCELAGRRCLSATDCNAGERCDLTVSPGACVTIDGSECASTASCPLGYACEAGSGGVLHCVNRRASCAFMVQGCPTGFWCGTEYCLREVRSCTTIADCFLLVYDPDHVCTDVTGDGTTECVHTGEFSTGCTTNADCPGATCDNTPDAVGTECGPGGFCTSDGVCGTGRHCVDVHGDGFRQCIPTTGCQHDTECPAGQLCSDWTDSGTGTCRG